MRFGGAGQKVAFAFSFLVLLKGMRTRSQSKILSCCFGVNQAIISYWADSHLESCQTSTMKLPPREQPAALRHWLFPQESTAGDSKLDSKWPQIEGLCKCGVWLDCKCMDFVTTGLCTRKWLRIHPAIRDLTCGASTGSNGTKGDRVRMAPRLSFYFFWGRRGWRGAGRVSKYSCFFIDDLQFATLTHLNNEPVFAIYFYREVPFCFFLFLKGVTISVLFIIYVFLCIPYVRLVFYFVALYKYSLYLYIYNILCVYIWCLFSYFYCV